MKTQMIDRNCQEASTSTQPSTNQQQQNQFGINCSGNQQGYRGNRGFQPQRPPNPNQSNRGFFGNQSNRGNQPFRGRFGNPFPVYQGNQQYWNQPPFANQYQQQCNQQLFPNQIWTSQKCSQNPQKKQKYRKHKTGKISSQSTKIRKTNEKVLPQEIFDLYAVIPESDKTLSYFKLQFAHKTFRRALVNTGACANVISQETFNDLTTNKALFERIQTQKSKLKRKRMA